MKKRTEILIGTLIGTVIALLILIFLLYVHNTNAMPIVKRTSQHLANHQPQATTRQPSGTIDEQSNYHTQRWRQLRMQYLQRNPLCIECQKRGRIRAATVCDHIIPDRVNDLSFFDVSNIQALCASCHNRKSASERNLYRSKGEGA